MKMEMVLMKNVPHTLKKKKMEKESRCESKLRISCIRAAACGPD